MDSLILIIVFKLSHEETREKDEMSLDETYAGKNEQYLA